MRNSLRYKILASVLALGAFNYSLPANALADDYYVQKDNEIVTDSYDNVYGNEYTFTVETGDTNHIGTVYGKNVTIKQSDITRAVGERSDNGNSNGNNITINDSIANYIYGGFIYDNGEISGNTVFIKNSIIRDKAYGGFTDGYGNVIGNTINITGNSDLTEINGGYSGNGNAYNNHVVIGEDHVVIDGDTIADYVWGGSSITREAVSNTVTINVATINNFVKGGSSNNGNVYKNTVNITDSAINTIYGGDSEKGTAYKNTVFITNSDVNTVYGGHSTNANAYENSININGGTVNLIYGASSFLGNVFNNTVSITNASIQGFVYAGESTAGDVYNNTVTINNSSIGDYDIYGGISYADGNVHHNTVNLSKISANNDIYGGSSLGGGNTDYNVVKINNYTTITGNVYGGASYNGGNANHNSVEINDSIIKYSDDSYEPKGFVYGGYSQNGSEANNNAVSVSNSTVERIFGGYSTDSNSIGNNVNISNGSIITTNVYGGYSKSGEKVSDNTVTIIDSTANIEVYGGYSNNNNNNNNDSSEVSNNTVIISGNSEASNVFGGYSEANGKVSNNHIVIDGKSIINTVIGGSSGSGDVTYNAVTINSGTINGDIYGGQSHNGNAINNKINISGSANIKNANLYGGESRSGGTVSGNTLTLDAWSGAVNSVNNFESLNFNNINWKNGTTVLTINDAASSDLSNTSIDTVSFAGGSNIKAGESMTLIANSNNFSTADTTTDFTAGVALTGTGAAEKEGNNLVYKVKSVRTSKQADLVIQSRAVAAAFINQGTDLISDSLDTLNRDDAYGVKTFAAVHGNRSKYDVNSDLKINGWSTIVGVGNSAEFNDGDEFSWGVFYENGSDNYRTYNEFNNEFFRGDGSLVYNGGGIAARYENASGVYTEGSLRAGMLKNEMDNVLQDPNHVGHGYETESAYYGAHIGVGKIISLSDSSDLDVYGKFFHTYTEGDSFTVANDKFDLDSITSDRLRLGARVTTNKANAFSTYYGLAYEYEFNGDADMTAQGVAAPQESLQGSSYMAEVGFNYQPTPDSPWSFDLNLRGYAGEREGGSFNVQATYTF